MGKRMQQQKICGCSICGEGFIATRSHADTCSPKCKQIKYRRKKAVDAELKRNGFTGAEAERVKTAKRKARTLLERMGAHRMGKGMYSFTDCGREHPFPECECLACSKSRRKNGGDKSRASDDRPAGATPERRKSPPKPKTPR